MLVCACVVGADRYSQAIDIRIERACERRPSLFQNGCPLCVVGREGERAFDLKMQRAAPTVGELTCDDDIIEGLPEGSALRAQLSRILTRHAPCRRLAQDRREIGSCHACFEVRTATTAGVGICHVLLRVV